MNRRKFILNLTFGTGAAMLAAPLLAEGASLPQTPKDTWLRDLRNQARTIHVHIDYLNDGALPLITERVPGTAVFSIGEGAQNILMVQKAQRVCIPMFEISYNPEPNGPVTAAWLTHQATEAAVFFHKAFAERIEALIDTAHEQGYEVNQIYVPIRTSISTLSAYPDGLSIFTNMGMAAYQVDTPKGILNPWSYPYPANPPAIREYTGKISLYRGSCDAMPEECLWVTEQIRNYVYRT